MALTGGCLEARAKQKTMKSPQNANNVIDIYNYCAGIEAITLIEALATVQQPKHLRSVCFHITFIDSKSGQSHHTEFCPQNWWNLDTQQKCPKKLHLTCLNTETVTLILPDNGTNGILTQLDSLHYAYTVQPKMNEKQNTTIHNGQTLGQAIKGLLQEDTCIAFFCEEKHKTFCKFISRSSEIFTDATALNTFLNGQSGERNILLVNFTRGIDCKLPNHVMQFICPLKSAGDYKVLDILEATHLYDSALKGQGLIQDDPLNGITILGLLETMCASITTALLFNISDSALSKCRYSCVSKSILFMEYSSFTEDFNLCLFILFDELGLNVESNKATLEEFSRKFWDSYIGEEMSFDARFSNVKAFFKNISNSLNQEFNLIAVKNNHLELTPVNFIKPKMASSQGKETSTSHVLYIFDENDKCQSGFVALQKHWADMELD